MMAEFHGWRVVWGAFVLAVLGWGLGCYGPPVFLHAVHEARGFSIALVSGAVTTHFLMGALVVANLPRLYRRFGLPLVTCTGVVCLTAGLMGWALAQEPWQLFAATVLSGGGWVTMGAVAINAIISPWFVRLRPRALSIAYNGASIGGVIFSPLLAWLIGGLGFPLAAALVGGAAILIVWPLSLTLFARTPESLGQVADGGAAAGGERLAPLVAPLSGPLWRCLQFRTLAAAMALGLFAQIGLIAHLFSLTVPALGQGGAGVLMAAATAAAIVGRTAFGWLMPEGADRRRVAMLSYAVQIAGAGLLILSGLASQALIVAGALLFGFGIGNATSLPPLIAQTEFAKEDVPRVVASIVAIGQTTFAFAPAAFGLLRTGADAAWVFVLAAAIQALAIGALQAGRNINNGA